MKNSAHPTIDKALKILFDEQRAPGNQYLDLFYMKK